MACLVEIFRFGFSRISLVSISIGLADEGSVRVLSFGAFPWPFFYFWGAKFEIFLVSQTLVRRFGGLSVGNGIGSGPSFMGGH